MNYHAQLTVKDDTGMIYDSFLKEQSKRSRSTFTITKKGDNVIFDVKAKDATALRATLDGIAKLLIVYEKVINNVRS